MPYGIQVRTTAQSALQDLVSIDSARMVHVLQITTHEGERTVSSFDSNRGDFYPVNYDNRLRMPAMTFNNTTKLFKWWNNTPFNMDSQSNNFHVFFVENK